MSHLVEPDRFFENILGGLVGEEICSVSIGGASSVMLEDLGKVAGLCDVTARSDYPRNVVKLEQVSLHRETALPMISQSPSPSACVFDVDVSSWVI